LNFKIPLTDIYFFICFHGFYFPAKLNIDGHQTPVKILADLEHEFWISRYSVWICITECKCQQDISNTGG